MVKCQKLFAYLTGILTASSALACIIEPASGKTVALEENSHSPDEWMMQSSYYFFRGLKE